MVEQITMKNVLRGGGVAETYRKMQSVWWHGCRSDRKAWEAALLPGM